MKNLFLLFLLVGCNISYAQVGIGTINPTEDLHVEGTTRITTLGGGGNAIVMSNNTGVLTSRSLSYNPEDFFSGNGVFSNSGYGLVPIGTIVAWHRNAAGMPSSSIPPGWVICNGGVSNGITIPDLNGFTTSESGDVSRGRFLRGNTVSGFFQPDQANNLDWINNDDTGSGDAEDYLNDDGTIATIRNYSTSGDRFQANVDGVETRVTNMSVIWIMRVQ